jgi:hypothetical protein
VRHTRAAGHNALRGSGPDQKHAFDNALAQVGCPDRRIDRLCITCCSPSQPSHHAGCPARSRLRRKCDRFFVALAPGHHRPHHPRDLVGQGDGGDLARPPRQLECCFGTSPIQAEKPRPDRKAFGSATLATRAVASIGPTPGIAASRLLASCDRCHAMIIRSNSRICSLSLHS